jgi:hypothetical protein
VLGHTLFSQKAVVFNLDALSRLQLFSSSWISSFQLGGTALLRVEGRPVSLHRQSDRDQDLGSSPVATDRQKCLSADNNVSLPNAGFAHPPLLAWSGGLHSFHTPC